MFNRCFLKATVLVSTLFLSALIVSSAKTFGYKFKCTHGLTGVFTNPSPVVTVACIVAQPKGKPSHQHSCKYTSCSNGSSKTVPMTNCRELGVAPNNPNVSKQRCLDYTWLDGVKYSCMSSVSHTTTCYNTKPKDLVYLTCTDCTKEYSEVSE
ncbi:secreted protein [Melampsora americana]|nr:secreted protein [Melampsora americana]